MIRQAHETLAIFRADASVAMGGGHAMRCLTLASALESLGWRCGFAVNSAALEVLPSLAGTETLLLEPDEGGPAALRRRWPGGVDCLVVDHYGLAAEWEAACRGWARSILVLDDLADRAHDCDLLVDQTYGRKAEDYAGLVPAACRLLTGSNYALLRRDFPAMRRTNLERRAVDGSLRRVLVSLGATDPQGYSRDTLEGIAQSGLPLTVDVVLGAGAPHLGALRELRAAMPQDVQLHVDTEDMSSLMTRADLAIGAAGTSSWERCCLGLPSLMIVIAENQRLVAGAIIEAGAASLLPGPRSELPGQTAEALRGLAANPAALQQMSAAAAAICDGRGCDRLGLALVTPGRSKDEQAIRLRLAEPADEQRVLDWQSHPSTRRFSRNPAVPSAAEHHAWFVARLADPDCLLTIITLDGEAAGLVRLDPPAPVAGAGIAGSREISILVDPGLRGQGIALQALRFLRRWQQRLVLAATILPGNKASAALFREAGYLSGAGGLLYSHPEQNALTPIN